MFGLQRASSGSICGSLLTPEPPLHCIVRIWYRMLHDWSQNSASDCSDAKRQQEGLQNAHCLKLPEHPESPRLNTEERPGDVTPTSPHSRALFTYVPRTSRGTDLHQAANAPPTPGCSQAQTQLFHIAVQEDRLNARASCSGPRHPPLTLWRVAMQARGLNERPSKGLARLSNRSGGRSNS